MFKNETHKQMMAVAVAAMFMLCAFGACFMSNDMDATDNDGNKYIIGMRVGDAFSYNVSTNLTDATVAMTSGTLTWEPSMNGGKLSGSYSAAGNYSNVLEAKWNHDSGLSQTATQQIDFQIVNKIHIDGVNPGADKTVDIALNKSTAVDEVVYVPKFAKTGNDATPAETAWEALQVVAPDGGTANDFTFGEDGIKVGAALKEGTYTLTLPASYSIAVTGSGYANDLGTITDNATLTIKIEVAADYDFSITEHTYTYVDNTDNIVLTPAVVNGTGAEVTWALDAQADTNVLNLGDNGEITVDDTASKVGTITGDSKFFSATLSVTGTKTVGTSGTVPVSASHAFDVTVYRNLAFTSEPTVSNVNGYTSSINPLDALISMNVGCADKVIFNWGDNTAPQTQILNGSESSVVTGAHTYATPGAYTITVKAYNNFGNTAAVIMYNAEGFTEPETQEVTIKDKDGATVGKVVVPINSTFRISEIQIDAGYSFEGKKIVALYTAVESDKTFDAAKKWIQNTNRVTSTLSTLYAEIEDTTPADDFFAEHGWMFILFAVLTILGIVAMFYFGYQTPAVIGLTVVFAILAVLCFVYKDFDGIIAAIQNLFGTNTQ